MCARVRIGVPAVMWLLGALSAPASSARCEGTTGDQGGNKYVQVNVSVLQSTLRRGEAGTIHVKLSPAEDIYINADPALAIKLSSTTILSLTGKAGTDVDTSTGYISTESPVTQSFTVTRRARPGIYRVTGLMTYFYCSKSEGWCRKQVEPIEFALTITR